MAGWAEILLVVYLVGIVVAVILVGVIGDSGTGEEILVGPFWPAVLFFLILLGLSRLGEKMAQRWVDR